MPDIAGVLNIEVRFPRTEGPGFVHGMFVELEDEGTVAIGMYKKDGTPYAYSRITLAQFDQIHAVLHRGSALAHDTLRRDGD